ncbi:MAG: ATP-dependent DNA helicase RecG [Candidatus Delongbacteria bacterium]|jgi:ATP-dependent DNA helicase RecG|nr:ATP-dependent DNA helicase RecG [Candidatus Delongbacteria bacterium]
MASQFKNDIKFLKGVGPKRAELLKKELDIHSFEDLLNYFPYRHTDRSKFYKISELKDGMPMVQILAKVHVPQTVGGKRFSRLTAMCSDETGSLELVWFKGAKWIKDSIKPGKQYVIFGKPASYKNKLNMAHPDMELLENWQQKPATGLMPHYNTTEALKKHKLHSKAIQKLQENLINSLNEPIPETLPEWMRQKYRLIGKEEAIRNMHFPRDADNLSRASYRLKFEELFFIQLGMVKSRHQRKHNIPGYVFSKVGKHFNEFYNNYLPFELTGAQKRVIKEIRRDLGSGQHMNRLLQGDVGSGKTLVALMCMLIAIDNEYQAALMVPTEILAQQHFQSITGIITGMNLRVELLTGSTKQKDRKPIHEGLQSGDVDILIGTHALLEDVVEFQKLGLTIIDEQHRFGVSQRARLWKKSDQPPHVLVMTATPIPRTLAMTIYGDLDVSTIDELPPGRKPVMTKHATDSQRLRVFQFMRDEIAKKRQIFMVYPLISESEHMDYKDHEDGVESMLRAFPRPDYQVAVVHGKMKPVEKEKSMQYFKSGAADILVATTVIEVGVDIPNATVLILESAERFGLSQMHQLRGRVGRGAEQSYCILMTKNKLGDNSRQRIEVMTRSNDGFEIAEADMKLRGPGDIEGTQQSGLPINLKIANLGRDQQLLQFVRNIADHILQKDPELNLPENHLLKKELNKQNKNKLLWRLIS